MWVGKRAVAIAAVALLALAGCGGGETKTVTTLPDASVAINISNVGSYCDDVRVGGPAPAPVESVEVLIREARIAPDRRVDGNTMRAVLAEASVALMPCQPALARRLDRAVSTLP